MKITLTLAAFLLIACFPSLLLANDDMKPVAPTEGAENAVLDGRVDPISEEGTAEPQEIDLQPPAESEKTLSSCLFYKNVQCFREGERCRCNLTTGEPAVCLCTDLIMGGLVWVCT
ncbi:MAG: hypothetical protein K0U98_07710 [Deltaproteobacteria bacterium]|nr:hypothetical protein [Deltaproteobacteria bacterium]